MKKSVIFYFLPITFAIFSGCVSTEKPVTIKQNPKIIERKKYSFQTLSFMSQDNLKVYADYYSKNTKHSPLIIIYHQAGFSRGAFRSIAPRLVNLGFNVLAVDLRAGEMVNQVINLTHKEALKEGKSTEFLDVIPDLEASIQYAKKTIKPRKIIYWGSSYSAALGFYMAATHPAEINALVAYSPGEYFKIEGKNIEEYAAKIKVPVFISSSRKEKSSWEKIYQAIPSKKDYYVPSNTEGHHGTIALSAFYDDSEENWQAVTAFLKKLK